MKNSSPKNTFIPTRNNMGYMTAFLDPYSQKLVDFSSKAPGPFLDIGTANGFACKEVLQKGVRVIANDLDERHLESFYDGLTPEEQQKVLLKVGTFPDQLDFDENSLGAILICRVLHFFDGPTIERALKKASSWLAKGGRLCVVVETPYLKNWTRFHAVYEQRKRDGWEWPGWVEDVSQYEDAGFAKNLPAQMHLLDLDVLERVFQKSGLVVESSGYIDRKEFPAELRLDGRESVGCIGVKG